MPASASARRRRRSSPSSPACPPRRRRAPRLSAGRAGAGRSRSPSASAAAVEARRLGLVEDRLVVVEVDAAPCSAPGVRLHRVRLPGGGQRRECALPRGTNSGPLRARRPGLLSHGATPPPRVATAMPRICGVRCTAYSPPTLASRTDGGAQGPDPLGRRGHAPAPDHAHLGEAAGAGRQQARALLRDRGAGRRRDHRDRDHHRARRPATRSARRPATARSSAPRSPTSRRTTPAGLAHAVLTAEEFLGGSPFVMYLGDNLLRDGITDLVGAFREHEPEALILLTKVPDPWHYGVAELDGDSRRPPGREAEGPAQRHGAGRRLHVHPGDLRRRPRDRALAAAASSRSPTRSSSLIDSGSQGREPHRRRLVEGHRPARRHARGQPAGARGPRAPDRRRARRRRAGSRAGS